MNSQSKNNDGVPDDVVKMVFYYCHTDACFYTIKTINRQFYRVGNIIETMHKTYIHKFFTFIKNNQDKEFKKFFKQGTKDPDVNFLFKKMCKDFNIDYACGSSYHLLKKIFKPEEWENFSPKINTMVSARIVIASKLAEIKDKKSDYFLEQILEQNAKNAYEQKNYSLLKACLENVSQVFINEYSHKKILYDSISNNDITTVRLLVAHGIAIQADILHNHSWINMSLVTILMNAGADIHAVNKHSETIVNTAKYLSLPAIQFLFNRLDMNKQNRHGNTPLMNALEKENTDVAKFLIQNNVNLTIKNERGKTALTIAAKKNLLGMVKLLIEYGADLHSVAKCGNTIIHVAAQYANKEMMQFLLDHDKTLNVNALNNYKQTPLMLAMQHKNESTIHFCVEINQNLLKEIINTTDCDGNTLLMYAADMGFLSMVELFCQYGADINAKNQKDKTALYLSIQNNFTAIAQFLISKGADTNTKHSYQGCECYYHNDRILVEHGNLLHVAVNLKNNDIVKTLLDNGCNANHKDENGNTPLVFSVVQQASHNYEQYHPIIKLLCSHGASINTETACGYTPLQLLIRYNEKKLMRLFLEAPTIKLYLSDVYNLQRVYGLTQLLTKKEPSSENINEKEESTTPKITVSQLIIKAIFNTLAYCWDSIRWHSILFLISIISIIYNFLSS